MLLVPLDSRFWRLPHEGSAWWLHYVFGVSALRLFGWMVLRAADLDSSALDAPSKCALTTIAMLVSGGVDGVTDDTGTPSRALQQISACVVTFVVVLSWILLRMNDNESWNLPRLGES